MNTPPIIPDMTVLDVVSTYRETEDVFRRYDNQAGECICCNALFDTLQGVAVPVLLMRVLGKRSVDPQVGNIYLPATVLDCKRPCILAQISNQ